MEHIVIQVKKKKTDLKKFKVLNFQKMFEYWCGAMTIMPQALKTMSLSDYKNNKCLTWYERQKQHHDQVMEEFKNIFKWQKK